MNDSKFLIALGGEYAAITIVLQGFLDFDNDLFTVVQIDAHTDLRQTFEGSEYNHACVMRRIMDLGLPSLPIAIRCLCKEESDLVAEKKIPVVWA